MIGLTELLNSNRFRAFLVGLVLAFVQKKFPEYAPDKEIVELLIGAIIAFIVGDTVRPVNSSKPGLWDKRTENGATV